MTLAYDWDWSGDGPISIFSRAPIAWTSSAASMGLSGGADPTSFLDRFALACRLAIRLGIVLLFAWAVHLLMAWMSGLEVFQNDRIRIGLLIAILLAYALLIAVPFVPGVEIGISLMLMEGPWIAPLIYASTVTGLSVSYAVGERVPYARLHRLFADLRLRQACRLLEAAEPLDRNARLDALRDRAPLWLRPLVSRFRYVLVAVLVNLPGNSMVGGGGGILFSAGLSRLFLPFPTTLTILIAVAPVPLAVWVFGIDIGDYLE